MTKCGKCLGTGQYVKQLTPPILVPCDCKARVSDPNPYASMSLEELEAISRFEEAGGSVQSSRCNCEDYPCCGH